MAVALGIELEIISIDLRANHDRIAGFAVSREVDSSRGHASCCCDGHDDVGRQQQPSQQAAIEAGGTNVLAKLVQCLGFLPMRTFASLLGQLRCLLARLGGAQPQGRAKSPAGDGT